MAQTAEHLIVIGRGRLIADGSVREFTDRASRKAVRVRTSQATELRELLAGPEVSITSTEHGLLEVSGLSSEDIGKIASKHAVPLIELTPVQASLEEAFMELTQDAVEYHGNTTAQAATERKAS
jgi:ABC-2 type transport system ATP-binding protein